MDMESVLADLLACLGVHLPANLSPEEFKRSLVEVCMSKIRELTSKGQTRGKSAPSNANPLIPGTTAEVKPMYMSISSLDRLQRENESLKMQKHASDIQLALAPPPSLSPEAEARLVDDLARRMGAVPEQGGAALSMTDDDKLADILVS